MKKINNFLITISMIITVVLTSCSSDDKIVEEVVDATTSGAILRTLETRSSFFNRDDVSSTWEIVIEEQDKQNGGLLSKLDVYVSFKDNTTSNGANTKSEQLLKTFEASEFGVSENGLPLITIQSTLSEALTALGLANGQFGGKDTFTMRLEVTLTDGRTFTSTNVSGVVASSSFFATPYRYLIPIICIPLSPFPGSYTLDLADSFGDGWNGASIRVELDGTPTTYTIDNGGSASFMFNVPNGSQSLEFFYTSGSFDEEVSFKVTAPSGNVVYEGGSPGTGQFYLNLCDE